MYSNLGGGTHGLLGLVLTGPEYALGSPILFVRPVHQGALVLPAGVGVTNLQREMVRDAHNDEIQIFTEINIVGKTIIKHITQAIPELYVKQFRDVHSNAVSVTISALLTTLLTTYGNVEDEDLQLVNLELKMPGMLIPTLPRPSSICSRLFNRSYQ